MAVNFGTQASIAIGDYLGTPKGWNNSSPGFQPGVEKKSQTRFGVIFDGEAENHDKTQNIEYLLVTNL